jgi:hypothetical protein
MKAAADRRCKPVGCGPTLLLKDADSIFWTWTSVFFIDQ